MELTERESIDKSIELWTWLAETGREKYGWPEWDWNGGGYEEVESDCFLCEYRSQHSDLCYKDCPYSQKFGGCFTGEVPYYKFWDKSDTEEGNKKYASLFLEQLKQL